MDRQMAEDLIIKVVPGLNEALVSEYQAQEELFFAQPVPVQHRLEIQAGLISSALLEDHSPLLFDLPDQVACIEARNVEWILRPVPGGQREQKLGGFMDSLTILDLNQHLKELESSDDLALAVCGRLFRYVVARHLVHKQLPLPQKSNGRGPLPVYAQDFFMPQWVAFDEQDNLLVNSLDEAKERLAAMQHYLSILKAAEKLSPYIGVDERFQRRLVGILAQLINQGHAMARHLTGVMISTIRRRAAENSLNRGVSLSLPYFDDQAMEIRYLNFEVIPRGRIMFVPAFVVIAAKLKQMEVAHSAGFSFTTQAHLLSELETLERAFDDQNESNYSNLTE